MREGEQDKGWEKGGRQVERRRREVGMRGGGKEDWNGQRRNEEEDVELKEDREGSMTGIVVSVEIGSRF